MFPSIVPMSPVTSSRPKSVSVFQRHNSGVVLPSIVKISNQQDSINDDFETVMKMCSQKDYDDFMGRHD